jgi:hypothetical protein
VHNVHLGSERPEVLVAQVLLNNAIASDTTHYEALAQDSIFGLQTDAQIRRFQRRHGLRDDGIIGPRTWHALGLRIEIDHHVRYIPQHTSDSCWSACGAMVSNVQASIGTGGAALAPGGGLLTTRQNFEIFGRSIGYRVVQPPATAYDFVNWLRGGPAILTGHFANGSKHAVVISAVWSDGNPAGGGTILRVVDPWPSGRPTVASTYPSAPTFVETARSGLFSHLTPEFLFFH